MSGMNENRAYRLEVTLNIREVDVVDGYERHTNNTLSVNDSVSMGRVDFRGMLEVMAGLHEAIKGIRPADET